MNLDTLLSMLSDNGCAKSYVKKLSANDNSKNQVYFGGNFNVLNILPIQEIVPDGENKSGGKKIRFKTKIDFSWINDEGETFPAPDAQLILYPKYPEVRFSGFLKGCSAAPSVLMTGRLPDRLLVMGVTKSGKILGYVAAPDSEIANAFSSLQGLEEVGVFKSLTLRKGRLELDSRGKLLYELQRIHNLGWIDSKRLDGSRNILPCHSTNCGGYTLEAELGVTPNGSSEPDYLGWEVKQFGVKDLKKVGSTAVTLMTPEPTNGYYVDNGVEAFIRMYGYPDKLGREARINFGGIYKIGIVQPTTHLKLVLEGYNQHTGKIEDADGFLGLTDTDGNLVAGWCFAALLKHWNTKHANACYVPSINRKPTDLGPVQQYRYGNLIQLGRQTDFSIFLKQVADGNIYYDPGIKLELELPGIRKQAIKRRSQFRIKSGMLTTLYRENEVVDLNEFDLI
jgi:MvaI/BcnI restriction endonuclease family